MSPEQVAKQLCYLLRTATWSESPNELILGDSVYVTSGVLDDDDLPVRMPFGLIAIGRGVPDEDEPDLIDQEYALVIAASVHGDPLGENVLLGGPGASSGRFGKSDGRGILALDQALLTVVSRLTGAAGTPVVCTAQESPEPERVAGEQHVVWRRHGLKARCTRAEQWQGPQNLTVGVATPGQAVLAWDLPPDSYSRRAMVVRRATGSTAPTSATAGTNVPVSALATGVTVTGLAAGAHSFAVFMGHTSSGADSSEFYSAQAVGTYRTGTVT